MNTRNFSSEASVNIVTIGMLILYVKIVDFLPVFVKRVGVMTACEMTIYIITEDVMTAD